MTHRAYRIARAEHAQSHDVFCSGLGAALHGGRWNSRGHRMVYASDSRALATLELVVHLNTEAILAAYRVCEITIPENLCETVTAADLPEGWDALQVNPLAAQSWGDLWLQFGKTPAVRVPSVIQPREYNVLMNPGHTRFGEIRWGDIESLLIDPRITSGKP